ncbi:MAG: PocR ligand-binding domain-containing protein [Desulforhopalus sp.]|nr:PocR ligand-binding domain-containing protein [Desulforhopalus sp.]
MAGSIPFSFLDIPMADLKAGGYSAASSMAGLHSPGLAAPVDLDLVTIDSMFSLEELQRLQDDFSKATGVASIIAHPDGRPITLPSNYSQLCGEIIGKTEMGYVECCTAYGSFTPPKSDSPTIRQCRNGLWCAAAGITFAGKHLANWIIGQVREDNQDEGKILAYAERIGIDRTDALEAFRKVPIMPRGQFAMVAQLLSTFTRQLSTSACRNMHQSRIISSLKQDEENRERFRRISSVSSDISYSCLEDGDGVFHIDWMMGATEKICGYSVDEILAEKCWRFLVVEEDLPVFADHVTGLPPGSHSSCNLRIRHKNGKIIHISCRTECAGGGAGGGKILYGGIVDVSERKRVEEALRTSEEQYRLIVNTAREGIWGKDSSWRTNFVNPQMAAMLGYTPEEMLGRPVADFVVPEEMEDHYQRIQKRMGGGGESYERTFRHKDGRSVLTHVSAIPILDEQDRFTGSFGMFTDITESRRAEEEKHALIGQLQQARKMEAIGTLAGGIAHDFNNILSAVIGYSEMIRDDCPEGSTMAHDIAQVLNAGNRAKELVKQILAFSRQAKTDKIPLQPCMIINEAVKLLRASLPATINIIQDIEADAGTILADPTQIHQVIMNLCTNAFHAMEVKGGTLTIALRQKVLNEEGLNGESPVQPGGYVHLSIRDTGSGIPAHIKEKIFEPFFTTKEVGKGTGMGLATVYGIIQSYGGAITCNSSPREGTVFDILLPIIATTPAQENKPKDSAPVGKEHILFVDDEGILAEMGKLILERLGYRVTARSNSIEALTTFQNEPEAFDLVITDQTMPGMTGVDLSRRILQIRPETPIILCTGYSTLISEEQAKAIGIKGFAMKPMARKDIAVIIRRVMDQGQP